MRNKLSILFLAVIVGALDAIVFKGFEYLVNNGTHYVWDVMFNTGVNRWAVVPLAIVLGTLLSGLFVLLKQQRIVAPKINSMESEGSTTVPTLKSLGSITAIGLASLLAGASLGPEASLVALSSGLGVWFAYRANLGKTSKLLELCSIGGLLVAFVGSYILVLFPLLILYKKKQLNIMNASLVLLTSAASFGTLWLMDRNTAGYGTIPAPHHYALIDFFLAALLGTVTAALGWLLKRFILYINVHVKKMDKHFPWPVAGALFGLVLGLLYLIGGQSVQFSGSKGSELLVSHVPAYSLLALFLILIVKLLVTGWSLATGYRGGLVFPSIFIGVTIALIAEHISGDVSSGVMIGSIAGVFSAMVGPVPALIFIVGILPFKLVGIAIVGIIFAALGNKMIARFAPLK